jgi:hypothetical protein
MSGEQANDIFSMYQKSIDAFFAGIEKSIPNYHQSITNLQQEWMQTCENTITSMISLQRELVDKAGINVAIPESMLKAIQHTNEEILIAYSTQTTLVLGAINATKENIKMFNDNASFFVDMNKNIAKYWASLLSQRNA